MEQSKTEIKVFILYASETGNCEQISEDLAASLTQRFSQGFPEIFSLKRSKLNEFNALGIEKKDCLKVVVIISSSTGDGDSPENGELFHRFLRRESAKGSSKAFSHIFWTLLGLGSSDYSKFQGAPRFIANKLSQLGAQAFYHRGEADEATNLEKVVEPWIRDLPIALQSEIQRVKALVTVEKLSLLADQQASFEDLSKDEDQSTKMYTGTLINRHLICDLEDKKVLEIEIEFQRKVTWDRLQPGQSVAVWPQNNRDDCLRLIDAFCWNKDQLIGNNTVLKILETQIDIRSRKLNLQNLTLHFQFLGEDFDTDLDWLIQRKHDFTLFELLEAEPFAQTRVLLSESALEDGLPKMRQRYYSIVNDPYFENGKKQDDCRKIKLCFTLHHFQNSKGERQNGLSTSYLNNLNIGDKITCSISQNTRVLKNPISPNPKLLIICMGTGVVPFISILSQIKNLALETQITMFYQCRDDSRTCYYREFLIDFFTNRSDSSIHLICSRDIANNINTTGVITRKGYLKEALQTFSMLKIEHTHVLVCGNRNALSQVVFEGLGLDPEDIQKMKDEDRLLMELWNE